MTTKPSAVANGCSDAVLAGLVEEITDRLQAGEALDLEAFVAAHPERAEELRRLLPSLALLALAGGPGEGAAVAGGPPEGMPAELGDFRIVREVGRGGMGVVYEAEQLSLKRRVALKVLPLAGALDPRQLQRFQNEARAAACLHHTNIVPVHAVGCEHGVHFYAMQFIDGHTLADVIRQLRSPDMPAAEGSPADQPTTPHVPAAVDGPAAAEAARTPPVAALSTEKGGRGRDYYRQVTRLGVQAAEALDYAHQMGVVHRDIKPGNLIVDGRGDVWVTDFGLAQLQQGEGSLTLTGDLIGTLRYMSPEQALARRMVIDHRTDVYSLGATLYELLTLRPAFPGTDRQELLRQIAMEEPVTPRRLDRGIPAELETIVLKALEKDPAQRYATAQELADDLRRWLEDQPIRARRPTLVQRARKWMRRHTAAVRAAAAALMVVAVVAGATGLWWVQKRAGAVADARAALQEAERWLREEKWSEALSATRRAQGVLDGFWGDASLQRQANELRKDVEMAQRLEEARYQSANALDMEGAVAAYREAFEWYGLAVRDLDPAEAGALIRSRSIPMQLVAALDDWAYLLVRLKMGGESQLLAVARVADPDPWRIRLRHALEGKDPQIREQLAASARTEDLTPATAVLLIRLTRQTAGADHVWSCLRQLQQRYPADFWLNFELSAGFEDKRSPRLDEVIRYATAAVALRPESVVAHNNLGATLYARGRLDEAITECRLALRINPTFALAHMNLGSVLMAKGDREGALRAFQAALQIDPQFATAHYNLGVALRDKGRLDEAIAEYRLACRINPNYAKAHLNLGAALKDKGRLDEAITEYRLALRINPTFALAHNNLGMALHTKGRLDEAITEYRLALRIKPKDAAFHNNLGAVLQAKGQLDEAITEYRLALRINPAFANAHINLGLGLWAQGKFTEALRALRTGHQLGSSHPGWRLPSAQWVSEIEQLMRLDARLPAILQGKDQPKNVAERLTCAYLCQRYRKQCAASARFFEEAFREQPALADNLGQQHRYNAACAAALAGCGHGKDADKLDTNERARLRRQALDWLRANLKAYRQVLEKSAGKAGPGIAQLLQHWLKDTDFAGVRGSAALANLPEAERPHWQKVWEEVEALGKRATARPAAGIGPPPSDKR